MRVTVYDNHLLQSRNSLQAMVFGNADQRSGSGVLFSRNPSTGEPGLWGEVLIDAQGEDVVSGSRTPSPLSALAVALPAAYDDLLSSVRKLERHCRDMQDVVSRSHVSATSYVLARRIVL